MNKPLLLLTGVFLLAVAGCGEPEAPIPVVKFEAKAAPCSFPKKIDTEAKVLTSIDCLKMNLDNAFDSLVGKTDNELSMAELKKLQQEKLLEFAIGDDKQWDGLSGLLSLVHPQGRAAISREAIAKFLEWLRTHAEFLAKLQNLEKYKGQHAPYQYDFFKQATQVADELLAFLSDSGSLSLQQAQALVALGGMNRDEVKPNELAPKLDAYWTLKALVMESTHASDNVRGASLKTLIRVGIQAAHQIDKTYQWWETDFHPAQTPVDIESEWQGILDLAKNYFRKTPVFDIDTDEMRAQVRVLFPSSDFPDRIPDLVTASRKLLARAGDTQPGLVYGLLHLFDGADAAARDLRSSAQHFAHCAQAVPCSMPVRQAMQDATLKPVALVSSRDWVFPVENYSKDGKLINFPTRLSGSLEWKTVLNRFLEKAVMGNIFGAFDRDGDQFIPYAGDTQDIREATDIAYNIISILSSAKRADGEAAPLYVKPSTIIGAVGLIADEWVAQGNRDGKIDVGEFYATLKLYDDINFISQFSTLSLDLLATDEATARRGFLPPSSPIYVSRSQFIKNMGRTYQTELPYLVPVFDDLNNRAGGGSAVLDLIVPKHEPSLELFSKDGQSTLNKGDYIDRSDMLGPVAILVLLDRLILKCDKNEDERFTWDELDCVMPLALSAGDQIFTSGLFDMPLFVSDGAKVGIELLRKKGFPSTVAKVLVLNGSTRQYRLKKEWVAFSKTEMKTNTADMAAFFAQVSDKTQAALRKQISVGVAYAMSTRSGAYQWLKDGDASLTTEVTGVAGWDSLSANLISEGLLEAVSDKTAGLVTPQTVEDLWSAWDSDARFQKVRAVKPLLPMVFVLGTRPADSFKVFNEKAGEDARKMDPVSPANILSLLEGILAPSATAR